MLTYEASKLLFVVKLNQVLLVFWDGDIQMCFVKQDQKRIRFFDLQDIHIYFD